MNKYILDRVEEGAAVIENEHGEFESVPVSFLPENSKEGDVIVCENGEYKILDDETQKRKERIKNLRKSLSE